MTGSWRALGAAALGVLSVASILFLVGISTHFPYRSVRYGLIGLGIALLVLSLLQLSALPLPPS